MCGCVRAGCRERIGHHRSQLVSQREDRNYDRLFSVICGKVQYIGAMELSWAVMIVSWPVCGQRSKKFLLGLHITEVVQRELIDREYGSIDGKGATESDSKPAKHHRPTMFCYNLAASPQKGDR